MTGKEFKEFINNNIEDDEIVESIIVSDCWLEGCLDDGDIEIFKGINNGKKIVKLII